MKLSPAEEYKIKKAAAKEKIAKYNRLLKETTASLNRRMGNDPPKKYDFGLPLKYKAYMSRASKKNRPFELTVDQFNNLLSKACHYCGDAATTIDRKDSSKGYILSNSVPACKICNLMKHIHSVDGFLGHIEKIRMHQST